MWKLPKLEKFDKAFVWCGGSQVERFCPQVDIRQCRRFSFTMGGMGGGYSNTSISSQGPRQTSKQNYWASNVSSAEPEKS